MDDDLDVCWKCQRSKPPSPTWVSEPSEPSSEWSGNFRESKQPDGTVALEAFGHPLTYAVCKNTTFRGLYPPEHWMGGQIRDEFRLLEVRLRLLVFPIVGQARLSSLRWHCGNNSACSSKK